MNLTFRTVLTSNEEYLPRRLVLSPVEIEMGVSRMYSEWDSRIVESSAALKVKSIKAV